MSLTVEAVGGVRPGPKVASGKSWALLVAGSDGYGNYRHQADVCHAYQILKKGGLKDKNIIVFMYDDIAFNEDNPRPGVIINNPNGPNVYEGVPKDYTGDEVNPKNFFAVLSGNKSAITGGSGKVLDSGPDDTVFIFYSDHGAPGFVSMPNEGIIYGKDLVDELKKKHAAKSYKKMVIYMEACESGSMFEGLLPNDMNIYVTTASNAAEDSYAFYCPDFYPYAPSEYITCLGDLYSISWLEDSGKNDMTKETLEQQYQTVRRRTLVGNKHINSHVMQYGDGNMTNDFLVTYLGANHVNVNDNYKLTNNIANVAYSSEPLGTPTSLISQRDAYLLYLRHKLVKAPYGTEEKSKAQNKLNAEIVHRKHVDNNVHLIGDLLLGKKSATMMAYVRPTGQPLVDDWDCFKTLINTYESHCGTLSTYGRKYSRFFANMCNIGISKKQLVEASSQVCPKSNHAS
ncbi:Peptidase C13, legumain [Sesbania bispinosa]|nr:Peptidase C13, legumain [Sesbania bispinosa]